MSALAPTLEAFFTERLITQRWASPHTVASYRDTFRLLLGFAGHRVGKTPSALGIEDLKAELIGAFLQHLELERHNSVRTRNNRLAAIHSLFGYAVLRHPEHAELIHRVLAIPTKRTARPLVAFLTNEEIDALLNAPDRRTWTGRRDHALLVVAIGTGLRVSELTSLTRGNIELGSAAHVRCHGKGRKERITPLSAQSCRVLRVWLAEHHGDETEPLFPSRRNAHLSRDAVGVLVTKHTRRAAESCRSLATKKITPHVLRHTCAMRLLAAGIDNSVIALWLGHESVETTQMYLHADLAIKQRALERTAPTGTKPGRYQVPDSLIAFLEAL